MLQELQNMDDFRNFTPFSKPRILISMIFCHSYVELDHTYTIQPRLQQPQDQRSATAPSTKECQCNQTTGGSCAFRSGSTNRRRTKDTDPRVYDVGSESSSTQTHTFSPSSLYSNASIAPTTTNPLRVFGKRGSEPSLRLSLTTHQGWRR